MNEFTAKELEFRSKRVEALKMASDRLHSNAALASVALGDLRRAAVEVIDIAHDAVERVETENAVLKKQLEERDDDAMQARLTRLIAGTETRDRTIAQLVESAARQDKTIAELRGKPEERKSAEASDANDLRMLQDRLTRLTEANCKLLKQNAPLMDCVRWYAQRELWQFADYRPSSRLNLFVPGGDGYTRAESCLRSLGLLGTDDRSGERA